MTEQQQSALHFKVNVNVDDNDSSAFLFRPHLITVRADSTDPVAGELAQREAGLALPVLESEDAVQVQAIAATPEQCQVLIGYLQYLQRLPVSALDEPERTLLSHWGDLRGN